jgi:hypothetical protein
VLNSAFPRLGQNRKTNKNWICTGKPFPAELSLLKVPATVLNIRLSHDARGSGYFTWRFAELHTHLLPCSSASSLGNFVSHLRPYMGGEALLDQEKCLSWRISIQNEFAVHHIVNINWPKNS